MTYMSQLTQLVNLAASKFWKSKIGDFLDELFSAFRTTYLIARYGLEGAEKKVAEEYYRELMKAKELQNVSEHNKET